MNLHPPTVVPAQTGTQYPLTGRRVLGTRLRGHDNGEDVTGVAGAIGAAAVSFGPYRPQNSEWHHE